MMVADNVLQKQQRKLRWKPLSNSKIFAIGIVCLVDLALRHQHVTELIVGDGQSALPSSVAAINGGEAFADLEAVTVGRERLAQLASRLDVADSLAGHSQVSLPERI